MAEWQPIETAPLNEWLLLTGDPWGRSEYPPMAVGRGTEITEEWWENVSETRRELMERKRVEWSTEGFLPEYWMLLPTPPKENDE